MAAYAAYRHVELDHVGYGKKRVLKPPGGGSSDIFGVGGGEAQQSPRKVKQYMASNISLTDGVAAPSGTGPGSTSSAASTASSGETPSPGSPTGLSPARNGTAQAQPQQAQEAQQAQQDVGVVGEVMAAGKAPDGEPRGRQFQMQSHFSLGGDDKPDAPVAQTRSEASAPDGNPVTGEGYKAPVAAANRSRVPPGGYSSGLW